ncbi:hypothetical protein M407DRAFT_226604 [Tulasnella calospora MUT 4182]|uniref:Zinc finger Mcm10/DnaG-type domain-containing protein n=1 Tax=Tulasnella calospora MUT 4182 TaxID=1051891 RepID=A0A0C3M7S1_9AGAM|nr:hypothetical protein M407DRAFT_226604 [Tulasnella calospora MUT 4182]
METHKSEAIANKEKAERILLQIQSLKNQLPNAYQSLVAVQPLSPKRKADSDNDKTAVLIAGSPSPTPKLKPVPKLDLTVPQHNPSNAADAAMAYVKGDVDDEGSPAIPGSSKRDDTMAVVEDLELGPKEFNAPTDDPDWNKVEPYSSIRLSSRKMPHEDVQELMRARYYVSPSRLYSIIRPNKQRTGYDVAVEGDYVIIAVVAERGEIQVSQVQPSSIDEDDSLEQKDEGGPSKASSSWKRPKHKIHGGSNTGKKYVRLQLVDFGHKGRGNGTASGDALLSMLLFEADIASVAPKDADGKVRGATIYKGGSGGAFEESLPHMREGAVVAILNPRVMRPYQGKGTNQTPHPTSNILGITPTNYGCISILGYSKDLGMCQVRRKDGKTCKSWCDKRRSEVCEYHLLNAVKTGRTNRPEFAAGTSKMAIGAPGSKPGSGQRNSFGGRGGGAKYDPRTKTGLLPSASSNGGTRSDGQGATYFMAGGAISARDPVYAHTNSQKDAEAKLRRAKEAAEKRDEDLLKGLMRRQQDSGAVRAMKKGERALRKHQVEDADPKGKGKEVLPNEEDSDEEDEEDRKERIRREKAIKAAYTPDLVKKLGLDPRTMHGGAYKEKKPDISAFKPDSTRSFDLGPPPGARIKSGVLVSEQKRKFEVSKPSQEAPKADTSSRSLSQPSSSALDDSDSELEIEPPP